MNLHYFPATVSHFEHVALRCHFEGDEDICQLTFPVESFEVGQHSRIDLNLPEVTPGVFSQTKTVIRAKIFQSAISKHTT